MVASMSDSKRVNPIIELLSIQISKFASSSKSVRDRFPVFMRRLIKSTVPAENLLFLDFHANEESERPGIDGRVENANFVNRYVPKGISYWEIGTGRDNIASKANSDFHKRTQSECKESLKEKTFIFVTPHSWSSMDKWVKKKQELNLWKDVRAYDANTLEQWLEDSPEAQIWLAQELNCQLEGIQTLEAFSKEWTQNTSPEFPLEVFRPAYERNIDKIEKFFKGNEKILTISADSSSEVKVFLYACSRFSSDAFLKDELEKTVIFNASFNLKQIRGSSDRFTAVYSESEINYFENTPFKKRIIIQPFGAINSDIVLEHLSKGEFLEVLSNVGFSSNQISHLSTQTGRSITILRRQLLNQTTLSKPQWICFSDLFIPILLTGGFETANEADMSFVCRLSGKDPEKIKKIINDLASIDDTPIWVINKQSWNQTKEMYITNQIVGVSSIYESWFSIAHRVTEEQLEKFYNLASDVLFEPDQRWKYRRDERHNYLNLGRKYSDRLRRNILNTLIFLLKYSESIFGDRISLCQNCSENLISHVLSRDEYLLGRLEDSEISLLGQIAPKCFISLLESEYRSNHFEGFFKELLRESKNAMLDFRSSAFLSALEAISWQDIYVERVLRLLFDLSQKEINDNIVNKPEWSFLLILRSLLYRDSYPERKIKLLIDDLFRKAPAFIRKILVSVLDRHGFDLPSAPVWEKNDINLQYRKDIGEIVAYYIDKIIQILPTTSSEEITSFIPSFTRLDPPEQIKWLKGLQNWSKETDELSRQEVLHRLTNALSPNVRGTRRYKIIYTKEVLSEIAETKQSLIPQSQIFKNYWLFSQSYPSLVSISCSNRLDFAAERIMLMRLRYKAFLKIYNQSGEAGVWELVKLAKETQILGEYAFVTFCKSITKQKKFALAALEEIAEVGENKVLRLLSGFFNKFDSTSLKVLIDDLKKEISIQNFLFLLKASPFTESTWQIVESLDCLSRDQYWREVPLDLSNCPDRKKAVPSLMEIGRYKDCYNNFYFDTTDKFLSSLLFGIASSKPKYKDIDINRFRSDVISLLNSKILNQQDALKLELLCLDILVNPYEENTGNEITNVIDFLLDNPQFFEEILTSGQEELVCYYMAIYKSKKFLEDSKKQGGRFEKWIMAVKKENREKNELLVNCYLGQILAYTPRNEDDSWPCPNVARIFENVGSTRIAFNSFIELENMRGVHWLSDEGGEQERELVKKYSFWKEKCESQFVIDNILLPLIESYSRQAKNEDANARLRRYS